ncbi:MAG: hypothetical protein J2P36_36185 [Ktedonobacteraceae bacterium]|nr:hypothetical protein [Ktedonobacteraceae bacterium]
MREPDQNPSLQAREMVIYRHRQRATAPVIIYGCLLLLMMVLLGVVVWLMAVTPGDTDFLSIIVMLLTTFMTARMTWHFVTRQLLVHEPVIVVNHQGISIGKIPLTIGELFISWHEISSIYAFRLFSHTYLCIGPRDPEYYLSRFGFWKRLLLKTSLLPSRAPINVNQDWMVQSVHETLHQISVLYAYELQVYDINLICS